jgi:heavy metal sensor kinase
MNIRLRLTLWYTAILFLTLALFSSAVYIGLTRSLMVTLDNHLQREVSEIIGNLKFEHSGEDPEESEEEGNDDDHKIRSGELEIELNYTPEEGVFWRLLAENGQPLRDPGYFEGAAIAPTTLTAGQTQFEYAYATLANGTPIRLYTAPFVIEQQGAGVVQVAESYRHIQEVQRQLLLLLALGLPFILLAAGLGGWFLASNALNPIDRITRAARQISADDLHHRLNLKLPNDEVGRLAATFDQMLARLDDAFERQKRFIADASHEMRTPLTILKGDVEVALNRPRSAGEYRATLDMVNQTTDRLTALVEELFLLARADNHQFPLQLEPFDLVELLRRDVMKLMPRAFEKNISLDLDTPVELQIEADPAKLSRLLLNLIDNAIKYSNSGASVTVTATIEHDQAHIAIADTGPGIDPEHLPHLFERFYRVDQARSRHVAASDGSSGAGLGLSIAAWLAKIHGGRIEVESQVGQGTTFIVWLPRSAPDQS